MSAFTLERPNVFPNGTSVGAYPKSNWPTPYPPSGAPIGSATSTKTVASDKAEFTGLTEGVSYYAAGEVGGAYRYVAFTVSVAEEGEEAPQPLDSDLTAIAALSTTVFGRALLELANAAAGRTAFGLGTAATQASTAFDAAGSASTAEANAKAASQPLDSDLTAIAALTTTSYGRSLLELASAAAGRTALGLGTAAVEAASAFLSSASGAVTEEKLAEAVKNKLKGLNIEPMGFSVISTVEVVTYRGAYQNVASGETKKLIGMKYSLGSGTKAKFSIKQNGSAVTGFKELEAKSSEALEVSGKSVGVVAGDRFDLTVESIEGSPKDLIVTLYFENSR